MKQLLTSFCFDLDSLNGLKIANIVKLTLDSFTPTRIKTNDFSKKGSVFNTKSLEQIAESVSICTMRLETDQGEKGPLFHIATIPSWNAQIAYWKFSLGDSPSKQIFDSLTSIEGFNAGYCADNEDVFWQSTETINTYEIMSKPYNHLPKIPDEVFGGFKIDISKNPGRQSMFPGMWLQSSWRMWFGQGAFKYIPKGRLLLFPKAISVEELSTGAVFIELYENPFLYDRPENRIIQIAFRDWTGMDELEAQAQEFANGVGDPTFNIDDGNFSHGGIRLLTIWVDDKGNPIRRSKAVKKIVMELDDKGHKVWETQE